MRTIKKEKNAHRKDQLIFVNIVILHTVIHL